MSRSAPRGRHRKQTGMQMTLSSLIGFLVIFGGGLVGLYALLWEIYHA
jgi:Tfp pilus assembly protein PilN